jgi:hypothetical protein
MRAAISQRPFKALVISVVVLAFLVLREPPGAWENGTEVPSPTVAPATSPPTGSRGTEARAPEMTLAKRPMKTKRVAVFSDSNGRRSEKRT